MELFKKKRKNEDVSKLFGEENQPKKGREIYYFGEDRKSVRDLIAPNGANTSPLQYMTINDAGRDSYYVGLYIDKMPRYPLIASTFSKLMNFPGVITTVNVHPLLEESTKRVNKRIDMLDAEEEAAKNNRNRQREVAGKIQNAEQLARSLDSGMSTLFEVTFLLLVRRDSVEELTTAVAELCAIARAQSMELASTYASNAEAFLSSFPLNKRFQVTFNESVTKNRLGLQLVKKHILTDAALSTIFNHTSGETFHENGVLLGYNKYNGMPFTYDFFDKSHYSFTNIICGLQGYGKSATVKQLATRSVDFGYSFASIDYENNGNRGEYAAAAEAVGGVNYRISGGSGDKLNLFEINEETDIDPITKGDVRRLYLNDKITDLTNILLSMALSNSSNAAGSYDPMDVDRMKEIIQRVVQWLYDSAGIEDGNPDSLYEADEGRGFTAGRKRKYLPQMKDFYMGLLIASSQNTDEFKKNAFSLLLDKFVNRVKELYYCSECFREFTSEEYEKLPVNDKGQHFHVHGERHSLVVAVHGTAAYFDCQSTVRLGDASIPWYNFDISSAPESERPVLILVCMNFILENFIKRNSVDPTRTKKLVFIMDEFHKVIGLESSALNSVESLIRTARKRHCATMLITQSLADFDEKLHKDAQKILTLSETLMLLKHQQKDKQFIKENTFLSDSQIDSILSLGGIPSKKVYGEMCVVDTSIKTATFVNVCYLKTSEEYIVETDTEKRAQLAH